ncbi:mandelate racemase [Arthrobacter echini]|uniref:Mandelate racemase n=1 Tax=Arthrobacter echini TaxID=1529066 RepID=A0A4S5EAP2_9MICC|nr:mandelate racemase [Arthrobacter echini]
MIETVSASAYTIPTEQHEADGTASWDATTIVVVTVTAGGATGTGWTYGAPAIVRVVDDLLSPVVVGADAVAVPAIWAAMVAAVRNNTRAGLCGYAVSALDIALWDLKARLLGCSLSQLWGPVRPSVPIYGSGGFTSFDADTLDEQLRTWVDELHLPRVKIKIGESWGHRIDRDVARVRQTRSRIGPDVELYVDANGAYTPKQAVRLVTEAADADVVWFEEPVSSEDLVGLRQVRDRVSADVAAGEYGYDLTYFATMCAAGAVDCVQIDATRAGGYTEWHRIAAVAAGHQLQVSAHCAPNLHAHVGATTPNLRHLEYFSDHVRIEQLVFDNALTPEGGDLVPSRDLQGHGMTLRQERAAPYRVA